MKALATSSADLRVNQSGSSWRRVDGVEAMIQQWRRRAATMWLRTAADMVLAPLLVSNAGRAKPLSTAQLKRLSEWISNCSAQRQMIAWTVNSHAALKIAPGASVHEH